ncbi:hypothetical protein L1887_57119 [Cichorium endivia]|nr:hypothetical protein L1887_57119 [Cichorium endivia]
MAGHLSIAPGSDGMLMAWCRWLPLQSDCRWTPTARPGPAACGAERWTTCCCLWPRARQSSGSVNVEQRACRSEVSTGAFPNKAPKCQRGVTRVVHSTASSCPCAFSRMHNGSRKPPSLARRQIGHSCLRSKSHFLHMAPAWLQPGCQAEIFFAPNEAEERFFSN